MLSIRARDLERSRTRILQVSESLRREIARHLHGAVQNKLIMLLRHITELEQLPPGLRATRLDEVRAELERVIEHDIRRFSAQIYPDILRRGLVPSLQSLGDRFRTTVDLEMKLDKDLENLEKYDSDLVPNKVRLSAYRVAEEALTNVLKHAVAHKVSIKLERVPGSLRLTVSDDGTGFRLESGLRGLGLGLETMRDYVEAVGGSFDIRSEPGKGTVIATTFPLGVSGDKLEEGLSAAE